MTLVEALFNELKALRAGPGLTEARLRGKTTLVAYLGGLPVKTARAQLVALIEQVEDPEQKAAVKAAYGLVGGTSLQVQERRKVAQRAMRVSERTLIRRELAGLQDVAERIAESAEVKAQDQPDLGTADELWQLRQAAQEAPGGP